MRIREIDFLKGVAVILMVVFHMIYFPQMYGYPEFNYNTPTLRTMAALAQVIFLVCFGANMELQRRKSKNKQEYHMKSMQRIWKLAMAAACMSLWTYFVFGSKYFVKFGILHFVTVCSILFIHVQDPLKIIMGVLMILCIHNYSPLILDALPDELGFILGVNSKYSSIDHFPIIPWIIYPTLGIIIGQTIPSSVLAQQGNASPTLLETIGRNSFEIYMIHWVVLHAFCLGYPYIRYKN